MTKTRSALRLGGALAIALAFLLVLSACAESSKTPDETVEVRLTAQNDTLTPKALTASYDSDELELSGNLYWTYTAVKSDGYFATGQSSFDDEGNPIETYLNTEPSTDEDGNETTEWTTGLPSALPGKYSVGAWVFTFNAYTSDDMTTDDDEDGVPDSLYYQGIATSVTLSSGGENIVSVTVESVGEGTLVVKGATVGFSTDDYAYYVLLGDVDTPDFSGETSYSQSDIDEGVTISDELSPGNYTVNLYIQGGSYVWKNTLENVPIRANLTTVVSGEFEEEDASLVTAYISSAGLVTYYSGSLGTLTVTEPIDDDTASAAYSLDGYTVTEPDGTITAVAEDDESISYTIVLDSDVLTYSVSAEVSDADALAAVLAVDGATVVLTQSVTLDSYFEVENDTVIELGSYTITSSASVFSVAAGASLTVTADSSGSVSTTGTDTSVFYLADSDDDSGTASLTINGGTYSSNDVVVYASASADITITDGTFSGTNAAVCAYNSGTLNISGGTFEGDLAVDLNAGSATATPRSNNLTVNITGGTFTGSSMALNVSGYLSASDNITINITDGTFIGEVYIAGYATTTISGGTFTDSSTSSDAAYGMQPLHIRSGKITITGGSFKNNHLDYIDYATWDYFYTTSGSMEHCRDIVIEASNANSFGALDSVTLGSGITTGDGGILYAINPEYTGDTPTSSIDSSLSVTQHSSSDLLYYIPFYYLDDSYAYFTSYNGAETALNNDKYGYFSNQSICTYDSDSES